MVYRDEEPSHGRVSKTSEKSRRIDDRRGIMDVLLHHSRDSTPSARHGKHSRQRSDGSRGPSSLAQGHRRTSGRQAFEIPDNTIGDRLAKLKQIFESADDDGQNGLDMEEFNTAMSSTIGQRLSHRDLELLFMKVDANCDGTVDWEEFVTYILLEFQEKSLMLKMLREKPFPNERREIFSRHRDTILRLIFFSSQRANGVDYSSGRYVTLTKDGTISFWSLGLRLLKSYRVGQNRDRLTPVWMTDMVNLPNSSMIAITSTDRDIMFYDLGAKKFFKKYHIKGLDHCALCMDYWVDTARPKQAVLVWGDMAGNVYSIVFHNVTSGCLFGTSRTKQQLECKKLTLSELQRGLVPGVKLYRQLGVHEEWVTQVRYIPELASCVSCCAAEETAMYVGDFENRKSCAYFRLRKGILCFDYCPKNNIIVTGGMDYYIRVWNPYVNSKAIFVLKTHSAPITHILVNGVKDHCISLDRAKTVCIHDLSDQQLLQKISGRAMNIGAVPITAVFFNPKLQSLIVGTDHLAVLEKKEEEERFSDVLSHCKPICAALFNYAFQQVVTACEGSVVSVWDINTGKKAMQFMNAHKRVYNGVELPVEITAMSFDAGGRRLITGAKNGTVKMWNYNNGCCVVDFKVPDGKEITAVFHTSHRIYVTGWNRQVGVFIESGTNNDYKAWRCVHRNDVLSMAFLSPNILATGAYDGDIVVWSRETGQIYCRLNANESNKPITDINIVRRESHISVESEEETPSEGESVEEEQSAPAGFIGQKLLRKTKKPVRIKSPSSPGDKSNSLGKPKRKFSHPLLPTLNVTEGKLVVTDGTEGRVSLHTRKGYDKVCKYYEASVECIIFLESRENVKDTATVLASGAEGWVRAWSIHHRGGLLGQFRASQRIGDSVRAMSTDKDNNLLMTGDTSGYMKIWDISEYCIRQSSDSSGDGTLPKLEGLHSMRWNRPPPESSTPSTTLKEPPLLISFQAHTKAIRHIQCVHDRRLVISSSDDCSVRLWTFCGRYIGTFGEPWSELPTKIDPKTLPQNIPGELRRVASSTTLKVLNGGRHPHWKLALNIIRIRGLEQIKEQFTHMTDPSDQNSDLDKEQADARLGKSTILGKSYKRKTRHRMEPLLPDLREVYSNVGVYHTLHFADMTPLEYDKMLKGLSKAQESRLGASGKQISQLTGRHITERTKALPKLFQQYESVKSRSMPPGELAPSGRIKESVKKTKKILEENEQQKYGLKEAKSAENNVISLRTITE